MAYIHWSPKHLPVGGFILPVTQTGEPSRSFGGEYGYAVELGMYDPNRVYVMQTAQLDPRRWFGTFSFTRPEHYMYEVEPEDLGPDTDPGRMAMNSLSCARPRHPLPALTDLSRCSGADHTLGLVSQPRGACVVRLCDTDAERVYSEQPTHQRGRRQLFSPAEDLNGCRRTEHGSTGQVKVSLIRAAHPDVRCRT